MKSECRWQRVSGNKREAEEEVGREKVRAVTWGCGKATVARAPGAPGLELRVGLASQRGAFPSSLPGAGTEEAEGSVPQVGDCRLGRKCGSERARGGESELKVETGPGIKAGGG